MSPVTAIGRPGGLAFDANFVAPPSDDVQVAVYLVTLAPPLLPGPLNVTFTDPDSNKYPVRYYRVVDQ